MKKKCRNLVQPLLHLLFAEACEEIRQRKCGSGRESAHAVCVPAPTPFSMGLCRKMLEPLPNFYWEFSHIRTRTLIPGEDLASALFGARPWRSRWGFRKHFPNSFQKDSLSVVKSKSFFSRKWGLSLRSLIVAEFSYCLPPIISKLKFVTFPRFDVGLFSTQVEAFFKARKPLSVCPMLFSPPENFTGGFPEYRRGIEALWVQDVHLCSS